MADSQKPKRSFLIFATLAIGVTSFLALFPQFWFGIPSGHDFEFHLNSWIEVVAQWQQGILYPHWSSQAHFGYGEARYIFYPPASWILCAVLGAIFPWRFVPGIYNWSALTLAGASMLVLARRYLAPRDALYAAVLYAVNPYHLVIVYWRSAMAELLAASYLPLLVLYGLRLDEDSFATVAPLSILIAAGWLTNIPSAVMMMYSLGLLALWIAVSRRSWRVALRTAFAVAIGLGVAAIYLLPVIHQRGWVSLGQVLAPGIRPLENFLFSTTRDPDHNRFNRIVSIVALWEIVIVAVSLLLARRRRSERMWLALLLLGSVCSALMIKVTLPLWNHLPELQYLQFPWRWLLVLNVVAAIAVVIAFRSWWLRTLVCVIALGSVFIGWTRIQPPWWDKAADIQEMVDNQQDGIGNDGTDEYVPNGTDPSDIDQNVPIATYHGNGTAQVTVERWQPEQRLLRVNATAPGNIVLRLFNYPLWRVEVNASAVQTHITDDTHQMIVPVSAGPNEIRISWIEDWDRKVGAVVSVISLILIALMWNRYRQPPPRHVMG